MLLSKYTSSVVAIFLVSLLIVSVALGETKIEPLLIPDMSYLTVRESFCNIYSTKIHVKDGKVYLEQSGQLYVMDALLDTILPMLEGILAEMQGAIEVREVGEEVIDGYRTMRYQVLSKETGLVEYENWQALDLPYPLQLKSIAYDHEGNVFSITRLRDIEFEPDFKGLNFSNAFKQSVFEGPRQATSLTPTDFKIMVPWYDLAQQPLPNYELSHIEYKATFGSLQYTLTYAGDDDQIQVVIFGNPERLGETHGPSEFNLSPWLSIGDLVLEPGIISSRTDVLIGFASSINKSDANVFLKNVIIHPTLQ